MAMIEVPCKIGDTLYYTPTCSTGYVLKCTVVAIHISDEKQIRNKLYKSHILAVSHLSGKCVKLNFDEFNKTVFLSKEEAWNRRADNG